MDAAAPVYLHVGNVTVALVASASGLIAAGGGGRADGGVNELPDVHNQYTSNEFLQTRGLPSPTEGAQAR